MGTFVNPQFNVLNCFMYSIQKAVLYLQLHKELFTISNYSVLFLVM